jgi:diguanylate cyclase (GGDEF)-like protein/PAS domain S-box-containing protein
MRPLSPSVLEHALPLGAADGGGAEFLAACLDAAGVGTWRLDMTAGIALWDAVASAIFGFPAEPRQVPDPLAIVHPEDRAWLGERLRLDFTEGGEHDAEFRIVRPDGAVRWIKALARPIDGDDGISRWLGGIVFDVTEQKRLEEALREKTERAHEILDTIPQIIWVADAEGGCQYLNPQWYEFTGRDGSDLDQRWMDAVHPEDRPATAAAWGRSLATGAAFDVELRMRQRSGAYRWTLSRAVPERSANGHIVRWYGTLTDVHERILAEQAQKDVQAINRSIVESSPDCIKLLDREGTILFVNGRGPEALCVEHVRDLLGACWPDLLGPDIAIDARAAIHAACAGRSARFSAMQPAACGKPKWWDIIATPVWDEAGEVSRLVVVSRDITDQKQSEEQVRWIANHDSLTGLPNRLLFQERLDRIARGGSQDSRFALLLLDIDEFKRVNDTLGHDAGDALLCAFAERLQGAARGDDLVARLGGDEFAVILHGVGDGEGVATAVESLLAALRQPWVHGSTMLDCDASIGASLYPIDGVNRAELMKHADIALYVAKASGRGNLKLFRSSMRSEMQNRISMLSLARSAMERDWIVPYYQPKVDLRTGEIEGFEALLRWHHPGKGVQSPDTIAAAFEDLTIAAGLSDRMVERVIRDMRRWLDGGVEFGHVAINAAAAEFRSGDFAERLLARLAAADIPPERVQVEVTETVFLGRGAECVERTLKTLSAAGVTIALDDFGTGYASLSHLKQFPVDLLKIDRSFVRDLAERPDAAAIIRAVINLGHSLDIRIVAEGIETAEQQARLTAQGCDFGQGFLYSPAVARDEVPALLERQELRRAG